MNFKKKKCYFILLIFSMILFSCASLTEATEMSEVSKEKNNGEPKEQPKSDIKIEEKKNLQKLSKEENNFISNYVNSLTYLVYYNPQKIRQKEAALSYVSLANDFLSKNNIDYVELENIEQLQKKQYQLFEEEKVISSQNTIKWIAHKTDANIYFELSFEETNMNIICYDIITMKEIARIEKNLGDINNSKKNKLFLNSLKEVISIVQDRKIEEITKGIEYKLYVESLEKNNNVNILLNALSSKVVKIEKDSYSKDDSCYNVYIIGDINKLENVLYQAAKKEKLLKDFKIIMQIKNSLTIYLGS